MRVPGIPFVQGRNDYTDWDGVKYGIAIHNTSNDASDEGEASYATRRTDGVSSHLYADRDSVTQSLDLDDRAGHAGSREGNDHSIAVEITGSNGKSRAWWLANVAWDELGRVLAWIITHDSDHRGFEVRRASVEEMRRNPKVKAFYGHDDMRRAWGGTTHTDPGPHFPWDRLFQAVNDHLEEDDMPSASEIAKELVNELTHRVGGGEYASKIGMFQPGDVLRPAKSLEYGWGFGKLIYQQSVPAILAGQKAILAAVKGDDAQTIVAKLDEIAEQERQRQEQAHADLLERLDRASVERAEVVELVGQAQSGQLAAGEVVRIIGEKLTAAGDEG